MVVGDDREADISYVLGLDVMSRSLDGNDDIEAGLSDSGTSHALSEQSYCIHTRMYIGERFQMHLLALLKLE